MSTEKLAASLADLHSASLDLDLRVLKPLFGGPFGGGEFSVGSVVVIDRGLHRVTYFFVHTASRMVLASADTKEDAIRLGRSILAMNARDILLREIASVVSRFEAAAAARRRAASIEGEAANEARRASRRRARKLKAAGVAQ